MTSAACTCSKPSLDYQQHERRFGRLGESSDEDLSEVLPTEAELAPR
jgi:undecaprenyl diphosphate synthase